MVFLREVIRLPEAAVSASLQGVRSHAPAVLTDGTTLTPASGRPQADLAPPHPPARLLACAHTVAGALPRSRGQCSSALSVISAPATRPTRAECTTARPIPAPARRAARNP